MGCGGMVVRAWAGLYTFGALASLFQSEMVIVKAFVFIFILLIGWIPFFIMKHFESKVSKKINDWQQEFISFAGNPDPKFLYTHEKNGIALNEANSELILGIDDVFKKYPFQDIREWEISNVTPGKIIGGGIQGLGAQIGEINQAKANSGLYIRVKDIDHSQWQIVMDLNQQNRWYEILQQKINKE